jgi:hypothetical protein
VGGAASRRCLRAGVASPRLEEARSRLAHSIHDQGAIQKEIPCFAASLRDQQTAVARCTMQRSVVIGSGRIVVSTYRIAGTKALPFQSGLENSHKPPCDLDETTQGALIACRGGVDQDPALNWLPCNTRQHVEALLQRACRVTGNGQNADMIAGVLRLGMATSSNLRLLWLRGELNASELKPSIIVHGQVLPGPCS